MQQTEIKQGPHCGSYVLCRLAQVEDVAVISDPSTQRLPTARYTSNLHVRASQAGWEPQLRASSYRDQVEAGPMEKKREITGQSEGSRSTCPKEAHITSSHIPLCKAHRTAQPAVRWQGLSSSQGLARLGQVANPEPQSRRPQPHGRGTCSLSVQSGAWLLSLVRHRV